MNMRVLLAIAAAVTLLAFVGTAYADVVEDPVTVLNFSFQSNVVADGAQTSKTAKWLGQSGDTTKLVTRNPTSAEFAGAAGNGALPSTAQSSQALYNFATASNDVGVLYNYTGGGLAFQTEWSEANGGGTIGDGNGGLQPGVQYSITVSIGKALNGTIFDGFSIGVVDLTLPGMIFNQEFPSSDNPGPGEFKDFTAVFTGDSLINEDLGIAQGDVLTPLIVVCAGVYVDNVRVTISPVIPEPSTLVLLTTGLVGLLAYAWRKRK